MRIGLISDTHMPRRWKAFPPIVFETVSTCDLILHAGDVGELWVLDQLSQYAPVVAVRGNDETEEATAALPFMQTVMCERQRIVLTHSHYRDTEFEMEQRKVDSWYPKLQYRADFGKMHGAKIVVCGHSHIPMQVEHYGVLLINLGAIASGIGWTQQTLQSIAVMTLSTNTPPEIDFIDINTGEKFIPAFDCDNGFAAHLNQTNKVIVSDDLLALRGWIMETVYTQHPLYFEDQILPLCHKIWAGIRKSITLEDAIYTLIQTDSVPAGLLELLAQQPAISRYL